MRIAIFGAGVIGRMRARTVTENPNTTLVAVADPDQAAAKSAVAGTAARALADWHEAVQSDDVDAVIVSTPVTLHEEMCSAAAGAGKHVLCEKPLSNSLESCRRIHDAAGEAARTLAVGFNHRFYPSFAFLKETVAAGRIGEVHELRLYGGHDGLANFRADWMFKKALSGGGAMMDIGIHLSDFARYVLGEIREVYGVATSDVWNVEGGSEDRALAMLKSASGVPVLYQATWNEWRGYRHYAEAYGDRGMVMAGYGPMYNLLITQDKPGGPRTTTKNRYFGIALREKLRGWETTTLASFQDELAGFLDMVAGKSADLADGWAGLRAVEIADAVYESNETGLPVTLSEPPGGW